MGRVKKKLSEGGLESFSLIVEVEKRTVLPPQKKQNQATASFIAPELLEVGAPDDVSGFENKPSWDVAVRFQDLKRFGHIPDKEKQKLKKRAIQGVLSRARQLLGSVLKPERTEILNYRKFLESGQRGELDVLATLEEAFGQGYSAKSLIKEDALLFDTRIEKEVDLALVMDASLSMTGEKIAVLAVAVAVVALCVPSKRLALMGFDSKTRWIKHFGSDLSVEAVIEKVLELPAGGFTNLELALSEALKALSLRHKDKANVILISDGKYTEGGDPAILAPRFKKLNALKIGRDHAGRELMQELTVKGNGQFFEARRITDLPRTIYAAMRTLLR